MDYAYNLGPYSRTVTTASAEAQRWFDRGLNWCFGFHHEEALAAARADQPVEVSGYCVRGKAARTC